MMDQHQGPEHPRLIDAYEEEKLACLVWTSRKATSEQIIAEQVKAGYDRKLLEPTVHHHVGADQSECTCWLSLYQKWTMEKWEKVTWSDECIWPGAMHCLPEEEMAPRCTERRRQSSRGSVLLCVWYNVLLRNLLSWLSGCWHGLQNSPDLNLIRHYTST